MNIKYVFISISNTNKENFYFKKLVRKTKYLYQAQTHIHVNKIN